MSKIFFTNPSTNTRHKIDFLQLVSVVQGTSIVSLADSDHFIEFGLSEKLMVRIENSEDGILQVHLISTLNADEVRSVRLQLINDGEEPSAALVERRLHSLRQVYAIMLLLDSERREELAAALLRNPDVDLEQTLLHENERLYLEAAGPGSWWITALTKIKGAPQVALNGLSLVYGEGRQALFDRVQAGTQIKMQEAERAKDQRIIALAKELDKVKNPAGKAAILKRLYSDMHITNPQLAGPKISLLQPPDPPASIDCLRPSESPADINRLPPPEPSEPEPDGMSPKA